MKKTLFVLLLAVVETYGCANGTGSSVLSDDALLDTVELYTSRYFTEFIHPNNGLARERSNMECHGDIRSSATFMGYPLLLKHNGAEATGGPLFWAHYSWIGLCSKGLSDRYADYWQAMTSHVLSDYAYCVENPKDYINYSDSCWGLTAGYSVNGYEAHAPNNDLGVLTHTAALSSFPYAPEQAMAAARYWYRRKSLYWGEYGFYDGYSATAKWYPRRYLAIDQLTVAPMIENYRTGLLWKLFMSCPEIQQGLQTLDITYTTEN